jgi:hypothetical protein
LSSATSRREPFLIAQRRQRAGDPHVFRLERGERIGAARLHLRNAGQLEVLGQHAERERAERVGIGLERMRGAAKAVGIVASQRVAQVRQHRRRLRQERVHELTHEFAARRLAQGGEGLAVDGGRHGRSLRAVELTSASTSRSTRIGLVM